jgi:hypothetical protein
MGKVIIDAVFSPFQKTTAFPFSMLGVPSGSPSEELAFQEFAHGSADLLPRESGKLDAILRGLSRWPELMLDLEGSVDPENDGGDLHLLALERAKAVRGYLLRTGTLEPVKVFTMDNIPEKVRREGSRAFLSLKDRYRHPQ